MFNIFAEKIYQMTTKSWREPLRQYNYRNLLREKYRKL